MAHNLLFGLNSSVMLGNSYDAANQLNRYTQTNCSVTGTSSGYRIYRPANVSSSSSNQWGGFFLRNCTNGSLHEYNSTTDNPLGLTTGHTYILKFHISGKSSNGPEFYWTNQCGWGGGGLAPSASDVSYCMPSSNFNGEFDAWYKWTINDAVVKTCTTSYSYATAGKNYMSYMDFKYGFGYWDTGDMGTDIYLTNFRMYDITNEENSKFTKAGIGQCLNIEEGFDASHITFDGEFQAKSIIEY